ncbi:MAG TPA: class I SAM-dependent methyltransferase [Polyangiaceae bacterium]|nr:class I SAM-dependent methyltransferase [Polyangiaceae bacterium]
MTPLLYDELVPWYFLIDPPGDHADEATWYGDTLERATSLRPETLLELGSGAGNNALYLRSRFRCTLSDVSPKMLELSRAQNPECEHIEADMRTLRLGRTFDAVFIHDAISYMTTRADLRAALATAFAHTKPGGVAVIAPDQMSDTFEEHTALHEGHDATRALRCLEWDWDPDPHDERFRVEYAFLLRDGRELRAVHDGHDEGLFSRETWLGLLTEVGFRPQLAPRPLDDGGLEHLLLALRP